VTLRVLHVNDRPPGEGGGAEVLLERLVEAQRAAGNTVEVHIPNRPHRGMSRLLDLWDPGARRALAAHGHEFRPDVVHLHNVIRELSPSVIAALDRPTVMTVHDLRPFGDHEHRLPDPRAIAERGLHGPLFRSQLRRHVRLLVTGTQTAADVLRAHHLSPVALVPVPVTMPAADLPPPSSGHDVLFVGSLLRFKGVHVLLDAWRSLAPAYPEARLVYAGDGPERTALEARADGVPRVSFLGGVPQGRLPAVFAAARVVVVPPLPRLRRETSPLVVAEAAAHGRPLVVTDDPAVAETAAPLGATRVASGDADALAAAIAGWLEAPLRADETGRLAWGEVRRRHAPEVVAGLVDQCYRQVLS
jgi:glycosyltransferase involved in cell wall biosynthesis